MKSRSNFVRKIGYLLIIAVLVAFLYLFGHPAVEGAGDNPGSHGGVLAKVRAREGLALTQIGEIDPTSETLKLVTLGLRGVASAVLWEKANDYKMKEDWANFSATLNQIIKIQPNFCKVWIFQGWNLAYNVAVEFDDYRVRYRWIIAGVHFMEDGIAYNQLEPTLPFEIGRYLGEKMGRADEHIQYRRLFKADNDFHGSRPVALRDSWLVAKEWHDRALDVSQKSQRNVKGTSMLVALNKPALSLMYYAMALQEEGTFGEVLRQAWKAAGEEWHAFGAKPVPSSFGFDLYLNDKEMHEEELKKISAKIDELQPGLREKIVGEKERQLTDKQKEAAKTPFERRTAKQLELAVQAEAILKVTDDDVVRRLSGANRTKANKLLEEANKHRELISDLDIYRGVVNFEYWRLCAKVQQTADAVEASKWVYLGKKAFRDADLLASKEAFEKGFKLWRKVYDAHPDFGSHELTVDDMYDDLIEYKKLLNQLDEPMPQPFILQDVIDLKKKNK